jgi:CubicO group peptidase (beta-lactamase class C family)
MTRVIKYSTCSLVALLATFFAAVPARTQEPREATGGPQLDQLIRRLYVEGKLHGGVLIADGERVIFEDAWGVGDHATGMTLSTDDRFSINSLGKMFTAVAIMQLVEVGRLRLDDPLSLRLPNFRHVRAGDITIHMLLSHRSGLADYAFQQIRGELPWNADPAAKLAAAAKTPLDFEPGTMFQYSNTGYLLLGLIIEDLYQQSYSDVVRERIFLPLGMASTVHDPNHLRAPGTKYYNGSGDVIDVDTLGRPDPGDHGISNLRDLHRFMLALGSERLLSRESWGLVFTPHSLPSEVPENAWPPPHQFPYGYGFSLAQLPFTGDSTALAAAAGGAGLGSNHVTRFMDSGRIVIVWNNVFKRPLLIEVFEHLARMSSGSMKN